MKRILRLFFLIVTAALLILSPEKLIFETGNFQLQHQFQPPSKSSPLGRDQFGRELHRLIPFAVCSSLKLATLIGILVIVTVLATVCLSFIFSGWFKFLLEYLSNFLFAFPMLVLIIILMSLFQQFPVFFLFLLVIAFWGLNYRVIMAEVNFLMKQQFCQQALCLNYSKAKLFQIHLLPFLKKILRIRLLITMAEIIILENSLSFLGFFHHFHQATVGDFLASGWQNYCPLDFLVIAAGSFFYLVVNFSAGRKISLADQLQALTGKKIFFIYN